MSTKKEYTEKVEGGVTVWRGHPNFQSKLLPIGQLSLHPNNARRKHDVTGICASLQEHGQQDVVKFTPNGEVIAGNGRLKAARELGWKYLAANEFTADELRAINYAIADNRLSEGSEWDYEVLAGQLSTLIDADFDPLSFGWSENDLKHIMADGAKVNAPEEFQSYDGEMETQFACPKCGYEWNGQPR